jgi:predicted nucleic acid-binding Zn ribbon protein
MPTYVYEVIDENDEGTGEFFECVQPITDDALTEHPESGKPVRRVPQAVNIAGKWSDMKSKGMLSNKNLERMGFTKYEKRGDGYMERVAGKEGPRSISAD